MDNRFVLCASNVVLSEARNPRYMTVRMRMFSTQPNLNKVAVTESFIDMIVNNKADYVCMPLTANVSKIHDGDLAGLGHMYDKKSGLFYAERIGGFYDFEKVSDEFGVSLIGEARIDKRDPMVCEAIEKLYASSNLNFSFEIVATNLKIENGITIVDDAEGNDLYAMAVVSVPAYPEAKALSLVAEASLEPVCASDIGIETIVFFIDNVVWGTPWFEVFDRESVGTPKLLFVTDTYFILYFIPIGKTYKVEYVVRDNEISIVDMYQVKYVRESGEREMENVENVNSEQDIEQEVNEAVESECNKKAEDVDSTCGKPKEDDAVEAECKKSEDEQPCENCEDKKPECESECKKAEETEVSEVENLIRDFKAEIENLKSQLAEMAQYKAQIEKIEAERKSNEIAEKKQNLREFASKNMLDVNDKLVAEAIENLNYEQLVSEVMNKTVVSEKVSGKAFDSGFDNDPFGGLLDSIK